MEPSQSSSSELLSQSSSRELVRPTDDSELSLLSHWTSVVFNWTYSLVREDPLVNHALQLSPPEGCSDCHLTKKLCTCTQCGVCRGTVRRGTRHHCRRCWRPVCHRCWPRPRHIRVLEKPVPVCDTCAVPWALASLTKRKADRLFWGLYILSRAAEMPCLCVDPSCCVLTYLATCYACGGPTVMTQPHLTRVIASGVPQLMSIDRVLLLDIHMSTLRSRTVDAYPPEEVERCFRTYFRNFEDATSFEGVTSTQQAQDILLGLVCTDISYEYKRAPNISLTLSDIPYARLLKINLSQPRYTIMEAPGKVKFISFPGTHDWRTFWINFNSSQTSKALWLPLVEGIAVPAVGVDNDRNDHRPPVFVCGSMCKVWEYKVHSGFAQEAKEVGFSLDPLAKDLQNGYRLVLTGHSLGGAVAQLLTLQLLDQYLEMGAVEPPRILCVTVGAPLIGDYQLAMRVERNGWAHYFHNIVYRSDIVPRLTCGNELTWKMATQVLGRASQICQGLRNWFSWRRNDAQVPAGTSHGVAPGSNNSSEALDPVASPNTLRADSVGRESAVSVDEGQVAASNDLRLVEYVDKTIRIGRDVLAEDEEPPRSSMNMASSVGASSAVAPGIVGEDHRVHRRYACFGRYHFFEYRAEGYFSTIDSETSFGLLKSGCDAETVALQDHTMASYNRCIMLRLCGKRKDMQKQLPIETYDT
ncbi:unnamed protein product [Phytomonas sp. EM1]|nr:unnamed protein product [Phytomonas sp. EM1]|eukprot:CCW61912.1 unnamed protein product [Phytomonas sp. isolate EM1]